MESKAEKTDGELDTHVDKPIAEKDSLKVKVALRVRPLINRDLIDNYQIAIISDCNANIVSISDKKKFSFDKVYDMQSSQAEIYSTISLPLLDSCFKGYNGTIMAYGQTGSGKTYTMGNCLELNDTDKGIIPRTIDEVFRRIDESQAEFSFIIRATYVEIYNEEIYDLLAENQGKKFARNKSHSVTLREEKDGSILLCGAREEKIDEREQLYMLLEEGNKKRSVGSTAMNDESSRSHAIFTLIIEKISVSDEKDFVCSKFSFVDLAGSERLGRTEAIGMSMKEGININKGLLALGNVISSLTDDTGKVTFIPYRVSKLTRILRNSLGGNSRTWMIACVSPVLADLDESLNTLKYATRARKISNTPIINKDPQSAIIAQLKQQVFKLQNDVTRMKKVIHSNGLTANLEAEEAREEQEVQNSPGSMQKIGRIDTGIYDESNSVYEAKFKASEKEVLRLKDERNKLKKDLNEKNILYCKLITRVTELRAQNHKLVSAFEQVQQGMEGNPEIMKDVESISEGFKKDSEEETKAMVSELDSLRAKLAEKTKYASTLEDEYTKLLKVSTRENELLVEKIKECNELESIIKNQERNFSKSRTCNLSNQTPEIDELKNAVAEPEVEDTMTTQIEDSTTNESEDKVDQEKYLEEKKQKEVELQALLDSLQEKESHLKQLMEKGTEDDQVEEMTAIEIINLDKLTELEKQLMDAKKERDEALEKLEINSAPKVNTGVPQFLKDKTKVGDETGRRAPRKDSSGAKELEVVNRYKQKVTALESQIQDLQKRSKDMKAFDSKMKEKNTRIDYLQTEINKIRTMKIDMEKKLREGSQSFAKAKLEKQKEVASVKKELFKKSAEILRLKNLSRKQDLSFHRKLGELKRKMKGDKIGRPRNSSRASKRVTKSTFENIEQEEFTHLIETFTQKLCEHAQLEEEISIQSNTLLKYHTKLDDLISEIAKLEAERHSLQTETLQDEVVMMEAKQEEFETNVASCEEAIKIKRAFVDRLESNLDELTQYIDEGYECLLTFLMGNYENKEVFLETALNVMMYQIEKIKKQQIESDSKCKEQEAQIAQANKEKSELKKNNASLQEEIDRLEKKDEERDLTEGSKGNHGGNLNESLSLLEHQNSNRHIGNRPPFKVEKLVDHSRDKGPTGIKRLELDGLRNKLINSEIQKEGAMKMAETLREKYIQMQDILSTMMENQKPTNNPAPLDSSRNREKFVKPNQRRFMLGNLHVRTPHSVNQSFGADISENSPQVASTTRRRYKDTDGFLGELSREHSRKKRSINLGNRSIQGKSNHFPDFSDMANEINIYSKELKYSKLSSFQPELPAVGIFEMEKNLLIDFKKYMVYYDIVNGNFEPIFQREFSGGIGKIVGKNHKDENMFFTNNKGDRSVHIWDLREAKPVQSFKCSLEEVKGVEVVDNLLYVFGKSSPDGGACNFFDLSMLNLLTPAEKNQDIMVVSRRGNVIYNGCRSHYIRRIKISTMQSMTSLEPPHYDLISGFSWMNDYLISGSKDKVLKIWDVGKKDKKPLLVSQEFKATKDYIKVLRENKDESLMFTADDAGELKFWELNNAKLDCIGGITPSASAILSAEWIQSAANTVVCSSADRLVSIYKVSTTQDEFKAA